MTYMHDWYTPVVKHVYQYNPKPVRFIMAHGHDFVLLHGLRLEPQGGELNRLRLEANWRLDRP